MDKITKQMPDSCRETWNEMVNFDFTTAYSNVTTATVEELRGHQLQPTFPSKVVEYALENWSPREGDVLISSFPRTGKPVEAAEDGESKLKSN